MRYTVVWVRSAQDALADLWNRAPDRQAVAAASDRIDAELGIDAHRKGLPVGGGRRSLQVSPLGVLFVVDPGDCMVTVLKVRRVP
ncbi:MAG TPA: hypothetical protein VJ739_07680 [Gemmataceae bacterium]|nr:hypothetical protein [Gemmataceae bacterium]